MTKKQLEAEKDKLMEQEARILMLLKHLEKETQILAEGKKLLREQRREFLSQLESTPSNIIKFKSAA